MKKSSSEKKRYIRQVRSWLPCGGKVKRDILDRLRVELDRYLAKNPEAGIAGLRQRFGDPQQIAASYVEEMDTPELLRNLRIRQRIVSIIAAVALGILLMWAAVVTLAYAKFYNGATGCFSEVFITEEADIPLGEGE